MNTLKPQTVFKPLSAHAVFAYFFVTFVVLMSIRQMFSNDAAHFFFVDVDLKY